MAKTETKSSKSLSTIDLLDYSSAHGKKKRASKAKHAASANAERYEPSPDVGLVDEQVKKRTEDGYVNATSKSGGTSYGRIIISNVCT